ELTILGSVCSHGLACFCARTGVSAPHFQAFAPQHFLYFLPEPQWQGSLRPTFDPLRTTCCTGARSPAPAMRACSSSRRLRRWKASSTSSIEVATDRGGRCPFPSVPPPERITGTPARPP